MKLSDLYNIKLLLTKKMRQSPRTLASGTSNPGYCSSPGEGLQAWESSRDLPGLWHWLALRVCAVCILEREGTQGEGRCARPGQVAAGYS